MSSSTGGTPLEDVQNLPQLFEARVARSGSKPAYRFGVGAGWRTVSWAELAKRVDEVTLGLSKLGIEPGDVVTIVGETRPEWCICELAVLRLGGVSAGICPEAAPSQLATLLNESHSRLVFLQDGAQLEKIRLIVDRLETIEHIVVWSVEGPLEEPLERTFYSVNRLGRDAGSADRSQISEVMRGIDPDSTALILYTAGTTESSKAVCLSHRNVLAVLESMAALPFSESETALSYLPMCLAAEKVVGFYGRLASGMPTSFARNPRSPLDDIEEVAPTVFGCVPRLLERIHGDLQRDVAEGSLANRLFFNWAVRVGSESLSFRFEGRPLPPVLSLKWRIADRLLFKRVRALLGGQLSYAIVGAAPCRRDVLEFWQAAGVPAHEAYGLTECSGLATANFPGSARLGTVGKPLPGCEVRIADDGEVLIRGDHVFRRYVGDEPAKDRVGSHGWLHTGDIGRIDADGFLVITDRRKNVIVTSGGKSIATQNIEDLVTRDPAVSHALIIGERRPFVTALVALDLEEAISLAERLGVNFSGLDELARSAEVTEHIQNLIDDANKELSAEERITDFRILPRELSSESGEITPASRVRRDTVLSRYRELIDSMYTA